MVPVLPVMMQGASRVTFAQMDMSPWVALDFKTLASVAAARIAPGAVDCLEMPAAVLVSDFYSALAIFTLFLHALFLVWIIFGALLTRGRPVLRWLHIVSLVWGVLVETTPWPCPLTLLENWLEAKAGVEPYHGGFLLHYLDRLVYPNLSATALTVAGIVVCAGNLAFYAWQARDAARRALLRSKS